MKKSIEQLKNSIESSNTLDHEIICILELLGERRIPTDRKLLHSIFYEISSRTKKLEISKLVFDKSTCFPYSEELENALFRLEISGILPYQIGYDSKYDLSYLNNKNNFNKREKNELKKGAVVLKKALVRK